MAQWYCQVSGQRYGPISQEELQAWINQGRVKSTDQVWSEGMSSWVPTGTVPALVLPMQAPPAMLAPHRGTAVLVLGILGLVICFICGIIAWVMGNNDLRAMTQGRMDPTGRGTTQAGRICGIISVCLACAGLAIWILWFLIFAGAAGMGMHRGF